MGNENIPEDLEALYTCPHATNKLDPIIASREDRLLSATWSIITVMLFKLRVTEVLPCKCIPICLKANGHGLHTVTTLRNAGINRNTCNLSYKDRLGLFSVEKCERVRGVREAVYGLLTSCVRIHD